MTKALCAAVAVLAPSWGLAAASAAPSSATCGPPPPRSRHPSFCSIPATPTDVRTAAAYRSAVIETRMAGRSVVRMTEPGAFGLPLGGAEAFAEPAREEAAPPPSPDAPTPAETRLFEETARQRATPPPRLRPR